MMKSLQVITLGCSKNSVDTEHLLSQVARSYRIVPETELCPVDVLLVNTCGFIGDAKEESIKVILECAARKQSGEIGRLMVFGCLSQRYPDELPPLVPEVDAWFGAREQDALVSALGCEPAPAGRGIPLEGRRLPYAFLKISEGCNRRCSYCAIPLIRGAHRSVPMEQLEAEAVQLASQGVRELVIIAQDTTYYGLDLYGKRCLAQLLERLSRVEGIEWIRIHYSYPADFPEDVLDVMRTNPKLCKYMDIPLQHISDKVLSAMHRGVDGEWTRNLIARMREKVPGVVLRTTLIVGHPGEGRSEFAELMDFVREARFERMGAFAYSEEEGTFGAENLPDTVTKRTKQRRLARIMELQRSVSEAFNRSRVGSRCRVLVDAWADGILLCRSQSESPEVDGEILLPYRPEDFGGKAPEELVGQFLEVRITQADEYDLTAEVI